MQFYSDPKRQSEPHALPDCEVFELTAEEAAAMDEDLVSEYLRKPEYRLATMNSEVQAKMIAAIVEEEGVEGGWFYHYCFPGCLPEGPPNGPFATMQEAIDYCQEKDDSDD